MSAGAQAGVVGGRVGHHLTDRRAAARGALRGRHAWGTRPASARRIASVCATFVALTDAELPRAGRALRDRPGAGGDRSERALRRPDGVRRQEPSAPAAASLKLALDDVGAGNSGLEMLSSARSASSTGLRPERQSYWFAASARAGSTRSGTSTTPAPWSRSSAPKPGTLGEPPETYPTAL